MKRILVVDDYFEMLSFLRSMLELSNHAYRVVGVPSAEEGMLELQQKAYDLLITDLRLPGISGFDLARRARRLQPHMPVIMITAYTSDQGQQEAADLGIFRYFRKPLDADELVAAVNAALYGTASPPPPPAPAMATPLAPPGDAGSRLARRLARRARRLQPHMPVIMITAYTSDQGQQEAADLGIFRYFRKPLDADELVAAVNAALYGTASPPPPPAPAMATPLAPPGDAGSRLARRLALLRAETAAVQVVLTRMDGELVHDTGGSLSQEMPGLAATIAGIMAGSYQLAGQLGSDEPFTMQYQAGQSVDIYSANVGADYLISIFLDANGRRGRVGAVWVFAQRAIHDLLPLLPPVTAAAPPPPPPPVVPEPPAPAAAPPVEVAPEPHPVSAPAAPILPAPTAAVDLDAFWEQATQEVDEHEGMRGISWEEARRQGLISRHLGEKPS